MGVIKTSELTGAALDYACAIAAGFSYTMRPVSCEIVYAHPSGEYHFGYGWCPSTNWAQGGPIMCKHEIGYRRNAPCSVGREFEALPSPTAKGAGMYFAYGPTPLVAAMRCFVASKLGDEVDVPVELM